MITSPPKSPVRFRGQSFIAFVLVPEAPIDTWLGYLDNLAQRSPGFFFGRPVILDIATLAPARDDLLDLVEKLKERNIRLMGLEGADPKILGPDLPPAMSGGRPAGEIEVAPEKLSGKATPVPAAGRRPVPTALVIDEPVRSGQRIAHLDGDVTVLGSVSSGAEIIAGGSIHVYGALRGRAIAGTAGNPGARIYCRKLEAEFLAIDGIYRTADDVEDALRGKPVQAWVSNDTLSVAALDL